MKTDYKNELEHLSMKMKVLQSLYRSETDKGAKKLIGKKIKELSVPLEIEERKYPSCSEKIKKRESNKKVRIFAWLIPIVLAVLCVICFFDGKAVGSVNGEFCTHICRSEFGQYTGFGMTGIAVIVFASTRKSNKKTIVTVASVIVASGGITTLIGAGYDVFPDQYYNTVLVAGYTLTDHAIAFIVGMALMLVGTFVYAAIIAANHKNSNEYLR